MVECVQFSISWNNYWFKYGLWSEVWSCAKGHQHLSWLRKLDFHANKVVRILLYYVFIASFSSFSLISRFGCFSVKNKNWVKLLHVLNAAWLCCIMLICSLLHVFALEICMCMSMNDWSTAEQIYQQIHIKQVSTRTCGKYRHKHNQETSIYSYFVYKEPDFSNSSSGLERFNIFL